MKVKELINRIQIVVHALKKTKVKSGKDSEENKNVLIIFQQIFGDAIVISNSLNEYLKIYPKNDGYIITFLARSSIIKFLKETVEIPSDINLVQMDFTRFVNDFKYYKKIVDKYRNFASTIIVPGSSLSAEILATSCNAKRKVGLVCSKNIKRPLYRVWFNRKAYTEYVVPDKELMVLQRHRVLLNFLGNEKYQAKLSTLLPKEKIIKEPHYCVLCPGASKMEKCWPTERYVQIIDYIIENYDMNVHLCGGSDEIEFERMILTNSKYPKQVISHIGKTTFSEWSAIVQHADLVLGNDSATMHMAAASRRKAICIAGVYDKFQFFPYKVDILEEGDRLPVTILKDMPCEWCRTIGYHAGYGNPECKKRIKNNQCALCIDAITVEEIKEQVEKIMLEN